ncbi:hypothetical protein FTO74_11945 [Granulicella sp. WH15]|uniref:hypothetical protein n=1 Tax=Granulicella sp. WH15 TaxID=2602070 RepID=UPI0013677E0B|nr:hypothetical protein [Granulicella sp. WH15]QHN04005.1 hypothetical protein FTO74_11945 [Granulicella sp. WH15]
MMWLFVGAVAYGQTPQVPKVVPVPPLPNVRPAPAEPTSPPARDFVDAVTGVKMHLPAGWNLSRRDGELSTFRLDARSAVPQTRLRAVAALGFNPYPWSTFSGEYFYLSATPRSTAEACAAQATGKPNKAATATTVDSVAFAHGHDEHGKICVESRDEVLTALRKGSCVRLDLVITTFCAEPSGARDLTENEMEKLRERLQGVVGAVKLK